MVARQGQGIHEQGAGRSMRSEPSPPRPERARWPRLGAAGHPRLRSLLPHGYAAYTEETTPRHIVLPATTSIGLVVKILDSPYRPPQFVMGPHGASVAVEGDCAPSYLQIMLSPLGAYTLLGLPMGAISGHLVDLNDVVGPVGRRLAEQLRDAPTWRQRFALADRFLLRRLDRGPRPSPEVGWAWERLVAAGGAAPIGRLAREVGWSHKHLTARFKQQVGLPPKTVARLLRLEGVWRRMDVPRPLDWGQIAADAGYADQAHLIRDFREFTGTTPARFVAQMAGPAVQSVQDPLAVAS
jgi:AraC-like DNA-binding protein